jgi:6-phosphogluconolactonase
MSGQPEIHVLDTPADLFEAAAEEFAQLANQAVLAQGQFSVALSGGSTPKGMFALLAGEKFSSLPWNKIYFFWGDERYVPLQHPENNHRMANEALLSKVPVAPRECLSRSHRGERCQRRRSRLRANLERFFPTRGRRGASF